MAIPATQIRRGMVIVFEGEPCRVVEFRHHTPGNLRAMIQTKLRNIRTGSSFEHRFRSADTIERAALEQHEMEYLYSDGSHHHFMNTENYEQVALSEDELGDAAQWLSPGLKIQAEFYEGTAISFRCGTSWQICSRFSRAPGLSFRNPNNQTSHLAALRLGWRDPGRQTVGRSVAPGIPSIRARRFDHHHDRPKPGPRSSSG